MCSILRKLRVLNYTELQITLINRISLCINNTPRTMIMQVRPILIIKRLASSNNVSYYDAYFTLKTLPFDTIILSSYLEHGVMEHMIRLRLFTLMSIMVRHLAFSAGKGILMYLLCLNVSFRFNSIDKKDITHSPPPRRKY